MRKTSQDAGDTISNTSSLDNDFKKPGPGILKSTKRSIKKKTQNLTQEADETVIEPLLQNDKDDDSSSHVNSAKHRFAKQYQAKPELNGQIEKEKTVQEPDNVKSNKYKVQIEKSGSEGKRNPSTANWLENKNKIPLVTDLDNKTDVNDYIFPKNTRVNLVNKIAVSTPDVGNNINESTYNQPSFTAVEPRVTNEIIETSHNYNRSPLIFTTAKIHTDQYHSQIQPYQMNAFPIVATAEKSISMTQNGVAYAPTSVNKIESEDNSIPKVVANANIQLQQNLNCQNNNQNEDINNITPTSQNQRIDLKSEEDTVNIKTMQSQKPFSQPTSFQLADITVPSQSLKTITTSTVKVNLPKQHSTREPGNYNIPVKTTMPSNGTAPDNITKMESVNTFQKKIKPLSTSPNIEKNVCKEDNSSISKNKPATSKTLPETKPNSTNTSHSNVAGSISQKVLDNKHDLNKSTLHEINKNQIKQTVSSFASIPKNNSITSNKSEQNKPLSANNELLKDSKDRNGIHSKLEPENKTKINEPTLNNRTEPLENAAGSTKIGLDNKPLSVASKPAVSEINKNQIKQGISSVGTIPTNSSTSLNKSDQQNINQEVNTKVKASGPSVGKSSKIPTTVPINAIKTKMLNNQETKDDVRTKAALPSSTGSKNEKPNESTQLTSSKHQGNIESTSNSSTSTSVSQAPTSKRPSAVPPKQSKENDIKK